MNSHAQSWILPRFLDRIVERRAVGHKRRAGENSFSEAAHDAFVDAMRHTEVICVDNQFHHSSLPLSARWLQQTSQQNAQQIRRILAVWISAVYIRNARALVVSRPRSCRAIRSRA